RFGRSEEACEASPPAKATRRRSRPSTPDDRAPWGGAAHGRRAPHMCLHEDRNGRHCVGSAARPHLLGWKRARPRHGGRSARPPRRTARALYTRHVPPRRRPMREESSATTTRVNPRLRGHAARGAPGSPGPATGPPTRPVAAVEEGDAAVAAADDAHRSGSQASLATRTSLRFRFRALVDAHRDEIAELITAEHGKVHSDALGEVARGLEIVDLACGI